MMTRLALEVEEEALQKARSVSTGLVRDGFLACRVPHVEQVDQGVEHAHRIGMAGLQAGKDFLGRLARPGLGAWSIHARDAPWADRIGLSG